MGEETLGIEKEIHEREGFRVEIIDAQELSGHDRIDIATLYQDEMTEDGETGTEVLEQLLQESNNGMDFYVVREPGGQIVSVATVMLSTINGVRNPDANFVIRNAVTADSVRRQGYMRGIYETMFRTMEARAMARNMREAEIVGQLDGLRACVVDLYEDKETTPAMRRVFYNAAVDAGWNLPDVEVADRLKEEGKLIIAKGGGNHYFIQYQAGQPEEKAVTLGSGEAVVDAEIPENVGVVYSIPFSTDKDLFNMLTGIAQLSGIGVLGDEEFFGVKNPSSAKIQAIFSVLLEQLGLEITNYTPERLNTCVVYKSE